MSLLPARADWLVDWIVPLTGGLFVVVAVATLLSPDEPIQEDFLEVALPLAVGLAFLALTPRFRRLDIDAGYKAEILWTGAIVGLLVGGVLLWEDYLVLADGFAVPVGERVQAVVNGLAIGFLIGGFAGYYRARAKQEVRDAADASRDFLEIFEKADVGIVLTEPESGTIVRANPRYAQLVGYDASELEGMEISEISGDNPDLDQAHARRYVERALEGEPQQFDWLIEHRDGSEFWAEVSLKHATVGGDSRLLAFVRDVTDRRRREQEREKFREIYEKADHAIGLTDPETGTVVETNPKYAEILGYEPEELEGMRIDAISADSPEFSQEEALEVIQAAMAGEPQSLDWQLVRNDGSTVWVAVSLKRATIGDEERLLAFFQDVSERKEGERAIERHRAEMEFFNSLLRHDVLNGITVIRTHGKRLVDSLDGEEARHAETVVEWADNTTGVIRRVRDVLETLTGESEPDLRPVDVSATLESEVDRLRSAYPDVTFETAVEENVEVEANDLLDDVVGNVLTNSVDHNDEDDLTVSASVRRDGDTVAVRIADDGAGIDDGDKEAVFRRGETGHVKKTGSGFGLYFVDSMMAAYGGHVRAEDSERGGAAFVLEFPAA